MKKICLAVFAVLALAIPAQAQCHSNNLRFNAGFGGYGAPAFAPGFSSFNSFSVGGFALQPVPVVFAQQQFVTPFIGGGFGGGFANVNVVNRGGLFSRRSSSVQVQAGGGGANVNIVNGRRFGRK